MSTSRSEQRRSELLAIAWGVIDRDGEAVSMDAIAAAAGITRPILYRHFGDVHGLWLAVGQRFADRLAGAFASLGDHRGRDQLSMAVGAYTATVAASPGVYRYLTRHPAIASGSEAEPARTFVDHLGASLGSYFATLGLAPPQAQLWGHIVVGAIQAAGDHWLDSPGADRASIVQQTTDLLWEGLHRLDGPADALRPRQNPVAGAFTTGVAPEPSAGNRSRRSGGKPRPPRPR